MRKLREALVYYDVIPNLPLIRTCKTLILNGELYSLRDGENLIPNNLRKANLALLPNVRHLPQVKDPHAFVKALVEFLKP